MAATDYGPSEAQTLSRKILETINEAVIADDEFIETVLTGVLARGHVLIEDVPGTGKTLTARTLANALDLSFNRIQFTPDLLPQDVTGSHIFDKESGEFQFSQGPIFANIVLADEINRAPPKTQAALLEAMEEGQVSVDGTTYDLPSPFFVIATQNPVEQEGTFELPEAQRDRFIIKTSMGYPDREGELDLLARRGERKTKSATVDAVVNRATVEVLQDIPEEVSVSVPVREYMVDIARATREDGRVAVGVSPRGVQRLYETSRARAAMVGRDYVAPDDVKWVAAPTLEHRLVLTPEANVQNVSNAAVIADVLDSIEVPSVSSA